MLKECSRAVSLGHFRILPLLPGGNWEPFLYVTISITDYQCVKSLTTPTPMMNYGISLVGPHSPCLSQGIVPSSFTAVMYDIPPETTLQVDMTG